MAVGSGVQATSSSGTTMKGNKGEDRLSSNTAVSYVGSLHSGRYHTNDIGGMSSEDEYDDLHYISDDYNIQAGTFDHLADGGDIKLTDTDDDESSAGIADVHDTSRRSRKSGGISSNIDDDAELIRNNNSILGASASHLKKQLSAGSSRFAETFTRSPSNRSNGSGSGNINGNTSRNGNGIGNDHTNIDPTYSPSSTSSSSRTRRVVTTFDYSKQANRVPSYHNHPEEEEAETTTTTTRTTLPNNNLPTRGSTSGKRQYGLKKSFQNKDKQDDDSPEVTTPSPSSLAPSTQRRYYAGGEDYHTEMEDDIRNHSRFAVARTALSNAVDRVRNLTSSSSSNQTDEDHYYDQAAGAGSSSHDNNSYIQKAREVMSPSRLWRNTVGSGSRQQIHRPSLGDLERIESGEVDDIDDHFDTIADEENMDLVDDQAIHIYSKSRLRAKRIKRLVGSMICCSVTMMVLALLLALLRFRGQDGDNTFEQAIMGGNASTSNELPPWTMEINYDNKATIDDACATTGGGGGGGGAGGNDDSTTFTSLVLIDESKCRQSCRIASCCSSLSEEDNCFDEFKPFCSEFLSCNNLFLSSEGHIPDYLTNTPPPLTTTITTKNDNDNDSNPTTTTSSSSSSVLEQSVVDDSSSTNTGTTIKNSSPRYDPSTIRLPTEQEVMIPNKERLKEINDACSSDKNKVVCQDLCEPYMCCALSHHGIYSDKACHKEEATTTTTSKKGKKQYYCDYYEICWQSLYEDYGLPDSEQPDGGGVPSAYTTDTTTTDTSTTNGNNATNYTNVNGVIHQSSYETFVDGLSFENIEEMLTDLCELVDLETDLIGREKCQDACDVAKCCWLDHDSENYCGKANICGPYDACLELEQYTSGVNDNDTADNGNDNDNGVDGKLEWHTLKIKDVCMDNYNKQNCLEVCLTGECCFSFNTGDENKLDAAEVSFMPGTHMACPNGFDCTPYYDCHTLLGISSFGQGIQQDLQIAQTQQTLSEEQDNIVITKQIDEACGADGTQEECQDICNPATCCFSATDGQFLATQHSCNKINNCIPYRGCEQIIESIVEYGSLSAEEDEQDNEVVVSPTDIANDIYDKCEASDLTNSSERLPCSQACQDVSCCYIPGAVDDCSDEPWCEPFQACANLLAIPERDSSNVKDDNSSIEDEISSVCGDTEKDDYQHEECSRICDMAKCCWSSDVESCSEESWCQPYEGCHVLLLDSEDQDRTSETTNDNKEDELRTNKDERPGMNLDVTVAEGGGGASDTKLAIQQACQDDIVLEHSPQDCLDQCQAGECCFPNGTFSLEQTTCSPGLINCMDYQDCDILILLGTTHFGKNGSY